MSNTDVASEDGVRICGPPDRAPRVGAFPHVSPGLSNCPTRIASGSSMTPPLKRSSFAGISRDPRLRLAATYQFANRS
jgi:hypothetical protein